MIVGLTGGIATGKSSISSLLARDGFPVIDADVIAREVVRPGTDGLREIARAFGESFIRPDGTLDRARLGERVFADKSSREVLNAIVHPRVRAEMWRRALEEVQDDAARAVILDVPLLIEGGTHRKVDVTVLVYAPASVQRVRLMNRNGFTPEEADRRIRAQMDIEQKRAVADLVVHNTGEMGELGRLAGLLAAELRRLAAEGARPGGRFDRSAVGRMEIV